LEIDQHLHLALQLNQAKWGSMQLDGSSFAALPTMIDQLLANWSVVYTRKPDDPDAGYPVCLKVGRFCQLHLLIMDARQLATHARELGLPGSFDAVFFDAFSPETSPELWKVEILESMFELLKEGGTLTSYCVKSHIRNLLAQVGFTVQRVPGPISGKREVLIARRSGV
jgi:hypothetical protein